MKVNVSKYADALKRDLMIRGEPWVAPELGPQLVPVIIVGDYTKTVPPTQTFGRTLAIGGGVTARPTSPAPLSNTEPVEVLEPVESYFCWLLENTFNGSQLVTATNYVNFAFAGQYRWCSEGDRITTFQWTLTRLVLSFVLNADLATIPWRVGRTILTTGSSLATGLNLTVPSHQLFRYAVQDPSAETSRVSSAVLTGRTNRSETGVTQAITLLATSDTSISTPAEIPSGGVYGFEIQIGPFPSTAVMSQIEITANVRVNRLATYPPGSGCSLT